MGKKHHIFNEREKDERQYLEIVKIKLEDAIVRIDRMVENYTKELQQQKDYLWEHKAGMDHIEKVAVRQSVTQAGCWRTNTVSGPSPARSPQCLRKKMRPSGNGYDSSHHFSSLTS